MQLPEQLKSGPLDLPRDVRAQLRLNSSPPIVAFEQG